LNEICNEILEYRDFRATRVRSPATLNAEVTIIRAFLYWCVEFKSLKENPAAKIKPRQVLQKPANVSSDEEVILMLPKANAVEQALLLTHRYTGMHEQEICSLAWDRDLKKKLLRVSTKSEYGFRRRPGGARNRNQ
jgi:site-specific recombinase XerC